MKRDVYHSKAGKQPSYLDFIGLNNQNTWGHIVNKNFSEYWIKIHKSSLNNA